MNPMIDEKLQEIDRCVMDFNLSELLVPLCLII